MYGNLNLVSSHSYAATEKQKTKTKTPKNLCLFSSEVGAVPFVQVKSGAAELREGCRLNLEIINNKILIKTTKNNFYSQASQSP